MRARPLALGRGIVVGAAAALAAAPVAHANPFDVLGAGPRASAMLVGTSVAEGAPAVFYNPAGVAPRGDVATEISFGVQYTQPALEVNGRDVDEEELASTWLGVRHPTELFGQKIAIGALVSIPFQRVSRLLALPLDQPQFLYFGTRNQRLVVTVAAGTEILPGVTIGAGVQTLLDTFSKPDFTLVQDPDATNDADPDADRAEVQSFGFASAVQKAVFAPIGGVRVGPFRGFELSLAYRDGVQASLSAPFEVTIEELQLLGLTLAETVFILPNDAQVFFNPNELSGGLAWRSEDGRVQVGLDVTWYDWSDFPATFSEATPSLVGGLAEVILPVPAFLPIRPPARDVVVPAIGGEWQAVASDDVDAWVRIGYSYRAAMVDEDRSLTNYVDANTHLVGLGAGLLWRDWTRFLPRPLSLDAYAQVHVLEDRTVTKEDPASSPFGDLVVSGLALGGGVSATVRF